MDDDAAARPIDNKRKRTETEDKTFAEGLELAPKRSKSTDQFIPEPTPEGEKRENVENGEQNAAERIAGAVSVTATGLADKDQQAQEGIETRQTDVQPQGASQHEPAVRPTVSFQNPAASSIRSADRGDPAQSLMQPAEAVVLGPGPELVSMDLVQQSGEACATHMSNRYQEFLRHLRGSIQPAPSTPPSGTAWEGFSDYLGEGVKSRLEAIAALHLAPNAVERCPDALRQLPANSNRIMLGAPHNCELYQRRVVRAFARHCGAALLEVDAATLRLDETSKEPKTACGGRSGTHAQGLDDDMLDVGGAGADYAMSDDDSIDGIAADMPKGPRGGLGASRNGNVPRGLLNRATTAATPAGRWSDRSIGYVVTPPFESMRPGSDRMQKLLLHLEGNLSEKAQVGILPEPEEVANILRALKKNGVKGRLSVAAPVFDLSDAKRKGMVYVYDSSCDYKKDGHDWGPESHETLKVDGVNRLKVARAVSATGKLERHCYVDITIPDLMFVHYVRLPEKYGNGNGGEQEPPPPPGASPKSSVVRKLQQATEILEGIPDTDTEIASLKMLIQKTTDKQTSPTANVADGSDNTLETAEGLQKVEQLPSHARKFANVHEKTSEQCDPAQKTVGSEAPPPVNPRVPAGDDDTTPGAVKLAVGDIVTYVGLPPYNVRTGSGASRFDLLLDALGNLPRNIVTYLLLQDFNELNRTNRTQDWPSFMNSLTKTSERLKTAGGGASCSPSTPAHGSRGRVVARTASLVQVCFDEAWAGGKSFPGERACTGWMGLPFELAKEGAGRNGGAVRASLDVETVSGHGRGGEADESWCSAFKAVFEAAAEQATRDPVIVLAVGMERLLRSSATEHWHRFKSLLDAMPARMLFIGAYTMRVPNRDKPSGGPGGGFSMLFMGGGGGGRGGGMSGSDGMDPDNGGGGVGGGGGGGMPPWFERLAHMSGSSKNTKSAQKGRALNALLPNNIELHAPHSGAAAKAWKRMIEADAAQLREQTNRNALKRAMDKCNVQCDDVDAINIGDVLLTNKEIEATLGTAAAAVLANDGAADAVPPVAQNEADAGVVHAAMAVDPTHQISCHSPASVRVRVDQDGVDVADKERDAEVEGDDAANPSSVIVAQPSVVLAARPRLVLPAAQLMSAAAQTRQLRNESAQPPERSALKDLSLDQFETKLSSEVIPPEELGVSFDDIGALDAVKTTLREVVMLPLQRPELFTRGSLTRPTKGLLLFGPPGTGKTMLAKAVACEAGAHFINVNMSSITSKWFGEAERLVKSLFSLAHKLAPSVIFVDEVDSFLSRRSGGSNEHEALRKMKNEFMSHWDGLRTAADDRVLVLAATNRPMDLDDAVIRRMPRRIFVPLPDAANREKILKVIVKDEELDPGVDLAELATMTDGYSGSDLRNLCVAAAYCPVRELIDAEAAASAAVKQTNEVAPQAGAKSTGQPASTLRAVNMSDFSAAMKQVTSSTHTESATMSELKRWNEQFGEGGSRRAEPLIYFT